MKTLLVDVVSKILSPMFAVFVVIGTLLITFCRPMKVYVKLFHQDSSFNRSIAEVLRVNVGPYSPPWWYSSVLGTLIPFGRNLNLRYERQIFEHENGATFVVDWFPQKLTSADIKPRIIVFLPGLGLSSRNVSTKCYQLLR